MVVVCLKKIEMIQLYNHNIKKYINLNDINDDDEYELIIISFSLACPYKKKTYSKSFKSKGNKIKQATEKCTSILHSKYNISETQLKGNIYCPFHEKKHTSKSASGKFIPNRHIYTCFSTKCPIPNNKNGKKVIDSEVFLKLLSKKPC